MNQPGRASLRRSRAGGAQRVTNIELFFDLVFVFAVTQLSHYLLSHLSLAGAVRAGLLLTMVWLLWAYTTWLTNWLDPGQIPVRLLLLALMLVSLGMSADLPEAFGDGGLIIGGGYAVIQVGRSAFAVWALRGAALQRNFQRILAWCCVSGGLALAGGLAGSGPREVLWLAAVAVDLLGSAAGFYTPGLGRSRTQEWDIEGGHFAERCQAFILIALGESIVVTGATLAGLLSGPLAAPQASAGPALGAFCVAFAGSAGLWWLYFDRSAEAGARVIAGSADPGRLGRSAYHLIHPVMVGGIIVAAAGDEVMLSHPLGHVTAGAAWLLLGGPALYIAGHAAFKAVVWRQVPWPRLAAIALLALLGLLAPHVPALVLGACAAAVVMAVAVTDYRTGDRARQAGPEHA
ncbi:MAG TPA: low temperature requirement protein A [Streptosporangiaceae bacterium]|nr:low temperature requirement protein A [Streptosporangiaceae bacterium]